MTLVNRKVLIFGLVGLVTISVGSLGWILQDRRDRYRTLAEYHLGEMSAFALVAKADRDRADVYEEKAPRPAIYAFLMPGPSVEVLRTSESINDKRAAYHAALATKYKRAADTPWISVKPDPVSP